MRVLFNKKRQFVQTICPNGHIIPLWGGVKIINKTTRLTAVIGHNDLSNQE